MQRPFVTDEDLENWFSYHPPSPQQSGKYATIRSAARSLAFVIRDNVPDGPDQTAAIRKLRECVMTANAGIACGKEE